jgi:ketosteroid isomerase-like protein
VCSERAIPYNPDAGRPRYSRGKEVVMTKIELVREYFALICRFSSDPGEFAQYTLPTTKWVEYPNAVTPTTQTRDAAATLRGAEAGKKLLARQTIEIGNWFEGSNQLLVEALWTGEVGTDAGKFHKGQTLTAHIAMVFGFEDGKIASQVNYDCYDAF